MTRIARIWTFLSVSSVIPTVFFYAPREDFLGAEAQLLCEPVNASILLQPLFTDGDEDLVPRMARQSHG